MNDILQRVSQKSDVIIKSRELNEAHFPDFTLNEYRLYSLALSKAFRVDKTNPKELIKAFFETHIITPKEFSEIFKVPINLCYKILENCGYALNKKEITIKEIDGNKKINICSEVKYNITKHHLEIVLSYRIIPHLGVTKRYVKTRLYQIADFKSVYSIELYELIVSFKDLGKFRLSVEKLKVVLGIEDNKITQYKEFKRSVLLYTVKEINKIHPKLKLEFTEIKTGRKVTEIEFKFKKSKIKELDTDLIDTKKTLSITHQEDVRIRLIKIGVEQKIVKRYSKYLDSTLENAYETIKKVVEARTLKTTPTAYFRYLMEI